MSKHVDEVMVGVGAADNFRWGGLQLFQKDLSVSKCSDVSVLIPVWQRGNWYLFVAVKNLNLFDLIAFFQLQLQSRSFVLILSEYTVRVLRPT